MSGMTFKGQTAWEESEEEVQKRLARAKASESGWVGTIAWVALGLAVLTLLFVFP